MIASDVAAGPGEDLLIEGRYAEGWAAYEQRTARLRTPIRAVRYPEWAGQPLAGKSIVVWGEQGLGDEIQFARFVPALRRLGVASITLGCHPLNVRLFEQLGADRVISRGSETPIPVPLHDYWTLLGSLPHRLSVTAENLSGGPYLRATPRERGGIGLVERGNPRHPNDANRSMPEGLLQRAAPQGRLLSPAGDMLDSAQVAAGLDLLITVDTSWAHLAGALGVPCWALLPDRGLDWRWLRERTDTPWYSSLRLFRNRGDWPATVRWVADLLRDEPARNRA